MSLTWTHTNWMTSVVDWREHAVTDADFEAGLTAGEGVYLAVCGRTVPPCSMMTPPGPPCRTCEDYHEREVARKLAEHKHRNRWWRRLARLVRRG